MVLALRRASIAGSGESGKSTIFKQMKILYGTGFKDDDRKQQVPVIMQNTIGVGAGVVRKRATCAHKHTARDTLMHQSPPSCLYSK